MTEKKLTPMEGPSILITEHLPKSFGQVQALRDVSLAIPPGTKALVSYAPDRNRFSPHPLTLILS